MLVRLIPSNFAPVETGNSLVVERFRTKFTLVVRSDNFFRFFFKPVNLNSKLTDLFGVIGFFLAFFGKFFPEIVFSLYGDQPDIRAVEVEQTSDGLPRKQYPYAGGQ